MKGNEREAEQEFTSPVALASRPVICTPAASRCAAAAAAAARSPSPAPPRPSPAGAPRRAPSGTRPTPRAPGPAPPRAHPLADRRTEGGKIHSELGRRRAPTAHFSLTVREYGRRRREGAAPLPDLRRKRASAPAAARVSAWPWPRASRRPDRSSRRTRSSSSGLSATARRGRAAGVRCGREGLSQGSVTAASQTGIRQRAAGKPARRPRRAC